MSQIQDDLVKAEIDLLRAQTIAALAGATQSLDFVHGRPQIDRIYKVIDTLTHVSEEKPQAEARTGSATAAEGQVDDLSDLPPEVRELIRQFSDLGIDLTVHRFPNL